MFVFFSKKNFEVLRLLHFAQELENEHGGVSSPSDGGNGRDFLGLFGNRSLCSGARRLPFGSHRHGEIAEINGRQKN